jgi:hypothetical protein
MRRNIPCECTLQALLRVFSSGNLLTLNYRRESDGMAQMEMVGFPTHCRRPLANCRPGTGCFHVCFQYYVNFGWKLIGFAHFFIIADQMYFSSFAFLIKYNWRHIRLHHKRNLHTFIFITTPE